MSTTEDRLIEAIENNNRLLKRLNHQIGDWKWLLWRGILVGLGGVIGATLVVSLIITVIQPFSAIDGLAPAIDRLTDQLRHE